MMIPNDSHEATSMESTLPKWGPRQEKHIGALSNKTWDQFHEWVISTSGIWTFSSNDSDSMIAQTNLATPRRQIGSDKHQSRVAANQLATSRLQVIEVGDVTDVTSKHFVVPIKKPGFY